jgi:O-antigen/teichoic acid export membrane protein
MCSLLNIRNYMIVLEKINVLKDRITGGYPNLVENILWRGLQLLFRQGFVLVLFFITAKLLPENDLGVYSYVLTIVLFLAMIGDFGISTATSKFVAEARLTSISKVSEVISNSLAIILGLDLICAVIFFIFGELYLGDTYIYALYAFPIVFLSPVLSLYDGVYRGLKDFKKLTLLSGLVLLPAIITSYFLTDYYGLKGALLSQDMFYALLGILLFFGRRDISNKFDKSVMAKIARYSFAVGLASMGYFMFTRFTTLIWGRFGYLEQVATYEVINKFTGIIITPFYIIGQVIAPYFTEHKVKKEYHRIYSIIVKLSLLFLAIGFTTMILSYLVIPFLIKKFLPAYDTNLMREILIPSLMLLGINVSAATIDTGVTVPVGYAHLMSYLYLLFGILDLVLSLIFINKLGFMSVIYIDVIVSIIMMIVVRILFLYNIKKSF